MSGMDAAGAPGYASAAALARFDQGIFLTHLNRGRKLLESGRVQEARVELERALELRPRDETTLNLLGMIYFKLDQRAEAAAVYRALLEAHPEADVLHFNLGVLEFKEGRYEDARRRLETALLLCPRNVRPHIYLGLIDRLHGSIESCLKHLAAAGAEGLIERLGIRARPADESARDGVPDNGDTGPMRALAPVGAPAAPGIDLVGTLAKVSGRSRLTASGRDVVFTVRSGGRGTAAANLVVVFSGAVRVRSGSALHLQAAGGSLHVTPADDAGLITLKGSGRLELAAPGDRLGRVALVDVPAGEGLHVAADRLLAMEAGLAALAAGAERALSRTVGQVLTGAVHLKGQGIAAISTGRAARAIRMSEGDVLLVHPRDLVCWTGALRARPASMGRLDQLLATSAGSAGPLTLEGAGEVVLDVAG